MIRIITKLTIRTGLAAMTDGEHNKVCCVEITCHKCRAFMATVSKFISAHVVNCKNN